MPRRSLISADVAAILRRRRYFRFIAFKHASRRQFSFTLASGMIRAASPRRRRRLMPHFARQPVVILDAAIMHIISDIAASPLTGRCRRRRRSYCRGKAAFSTPRRCQPKQLSASDAFDDGWGRCRNIAPLMALPTPCRVIVAARREILTHAAVTPMIRF